MKSWRQYNVLSVALLVSIALNLFFGGVVAGRIAGNLAQVHQAARNLDEVLAPLAPDRREIVRNELRAVLPEMRRDIEALNAARDSMAAAFAQTTLNEAAIEQTFVEIRARTNALQAHLQNAFHRAGKTLTVEERRAVLQVIRARELKAVPDM